MPAVRRHGSFFSHCAGAAQQVQGGQSAPRRAAAAVLKERWGLLLRQHSLQRRDDAVDGDRLRHHRGQLNQGLRPVGGEGQIRHGVVGHKGSAADHAGQQALIRTDAEGLRHSADVDIQKIGQLPLRRQLRPRQQRAGADVVFQTLRQRLVQGPFLTPCRLPGHGIGFKRIDRHRRLLSAAIISPASSSPSFRRRQSRLHGRHALPP